jgi:hypothetical protein
MPSRARFALSLSGLLSVAAIATGLELALDRGCAIGGGCDDPDVALVVGIPVVVLGAALLGAAVAGWRRAAGLVAQASCTVWAGVLLLAGATIGGADNVTGVLLACVAVAMGALSVWVPR